jgi:hypothetical protein
VSVIRLNYSKPSRGTVLDTRKPCSRNEYKRKNESRLNYIHHNSARSGLVDQEEEYLYSSARDYCGEMKGLIEIDLI